MTTELEMEIAPEQSTKAVDIGHTLRAKRLSLSIDERQVATELKLSIEHVFAIENGEFDRFRSATFARGYLKSYCRLLGLDHKPLLSAFDEQQSVKESNLRPVDNVPPQSSGRDPIFVIVSAIIVSIIVFIIFWWPSQSSDVDASAPASGQPSEVSDAGEVSRIDPANEVEPELSENSTENSSDTQEEAVLDSSIEAPALSDEPDNVVTGLSAETIALLEDAGVNPNEVVEATREAEVESVPVPETTAESVAPSNDIYIQFVADCWTEIRDSSGRILFSGVKGSGDTLELDGEAPYRVTLGYARGVSEFLYKGELFDFSSYVRKDLARFELK